jgi:hypothetical protein
LRFAVKNHFVRLSEIDPNITSGTSQEEIAGFVLMPALLAAFGSITEAHVRAADAAGTITENSMLATAVLNPPHEGLFPSWVNALLGRLGGGIHRLPFSVASAIRVRIRVRITPKTRRCHAAAAIFEASPLVDSSQLRQEQRQELPGWRKNVCLPNKWGCTGIGKANASSAGQG